MVVSYRMRIFFIVLLFCAIPRNTHADVQVLTDTELDQIVGANLPDFILESLDENFDANSIVDKVLSLLTPVFNSDILSPATLTQIHAVSSEVSVQLNFNAIFDAQDVSIHQSNSIQIP